jgi:hypothetical protein
MLVYMAKAPGDPAHWDGSGNVWFKINEWGPDFSSGSIQWPQLGKIYPLCHPSLLFNSLILASKQV